MNAMLHIGNTDLSVKEYSKLLLRIINSSAGDEVKIAAIRAATDKLTPEGVSVNNCVFTSLPDEQE